MIIRTLLLLVFCIQSLIVNCQSVQEIEFINKKVEHLENYLYSDGELVQGGFRDTIETGTFKAIVNKVNSKNYRITYTREYAYFHLEITYYIADSELIYIRELRCNITYQDCITEYINRYYLKNDKVIKAQMDKVSPEYNENKVEEYLSIFKFIDKDKK